MACYQQLFVIFYRPNVSFHLYFYIMSVIVHTTWFESLLEKKCPPDVADEDQGMTALMWAASLDNIEIGKTLIEAKASVNVKAEV
mmetsp:Transcript_21341/g.34407  ORF Transcript_21341/g.34407 Transcript_21341/m.34407 type:complete len:85 (-) Transcript_21341:876-1130(-)